MKKYLRIAAFILATTLGGYLITHFETAGISTLWKKDPINEFMDALADKDPFVHAVLSDHMDEAEPLIREGLKNRDIGSIRRGVSAPVAKYGLTAMVRATDLSIIDIVEEATKFIDILARYYPDGCKGFANGDLSFVTSLAYPQVGESFKTYSQALRHAYEDGKSRPVGATLSQDETDELLINFIKLTEEDAELLQRVDQSPCERVCPMVRKLYSIGPVPEAMRASYARMLISG